MSYKIKKKIKKSVKPLLFAVLVAISAAVSTGAQTTIQTVFDLESDVRKKAFIPAAVIAILKSDERVDQCFQEKGAGVDESQWFAASQIDLNADGRMDLIVKAADACLFGANQGAFWIFQNLPDGYQKLLSAYGLQLAVLPRKSNSFKQIKISKIVALKPSTSETFSYKAGKYQSTVRRR